jgi:hypothetical protein
MAVNLSGIEARIVAIDGTWNISIQTPMGARDATLTLTSSGSAVSGTFTNQRGSSAVTDGTSDGSAFSFGAEFEGAMGKMQLTFKGTVSDDTMSGEVQFGPMGAGPFSGRRA